jgi:type IV pilus assembly protein PilM
MGLFGSNEITGIDVGAGGIKAVRIKPGSKPRLMSAAIIEFSPEAPREPLAVTLRSLLSDKKIGRKNVSTLMPGRDLTIRSMSFPKMPLVELREAVRWEAKRHISYSLDAALVEYIITGEHREGMVEKYDIVMVASEESRISQYLMPFRETGIAVAVLDANALALRNALFADSGGSGEATLVVDIGAGNMEIAIFKEGSLRFSRCLETGGNDITRLLAEELNISLRDAEATKRRIAIDPAARDKAAGAVINRLDALLMEIRRSAEYYRTSFRERGVDRAVLTGGTALMKGLPDYFSRALGIPVALFNPFAGIVGGELARELESLAPRFSAAVGVALRNN